MSVIDKIDKLLIEKKKKQKRGQIKSNVEKCPECGGPNTSSVYYICPACLEKKKAKFRETKKYKRSIKNRG